MSTADACAECREAPAWYARCPACAIRMFTERQRTIAALAASDDLEWRRERDGRTYALTVGATLWAEPTLTIAKGGARGALRVHVETYKTQSELAARRRALALRRVRNGYVLVRSSGHA